MQYTAFLLLWFGHRSSECFSFKKGVQNHQNMICVEYICVCLCVCVCVCVLDVIFVCVQKAPKGQSRVDRLRKKMNEQESWLLLHSPTIPFRIHNKHGKVAIPSLSLSLSLFLFLSFFLSLSVYLQLSVSRLFCLRSPSSYYITILVSTKLCSCCHCPLEGDIHTLVTKSNISLT